MATATALGLLRGLVRGSSAGWASPEVVGTLAAGAVLAVAFIAWELRARAPMLPMRLFGFRGFSAGNAAIFLLNASLTWAVFFTAQVLQVSLAQDPLAAGLGYCPGAWPRFLIAPRVGKLADRVGERPLIVCGLVLLAAGLPWIVVIAAPDVAHPVMLAPMIISSAGFAMALPAVIKAVIGRSRPPTLARLPPRSARCASSGGAFGVAILAAVSLTRLIMPDRRPDRRAALCRASSGHG
jgi:hypothetical protein